jgi:competence protein ComEC
MSRCLGHRAPLLWIILPLAAGLAAARAGDLAAAGWPLAAALPVAVLSAACAGPAPRLWGAALVAALTLGGMASFALHRQPRPRWPGRPPREARLSLELEHLYPPAPNRPAATGLATIRRADPHLRDLVGQRVYFSLAPRRGAEPPERSEVVATVGILAPVPPHPPDGSFEAGLAEQGLNFSLTRGRLLATERPPTAYRRFCGRLAGRMTVLLGAGLGRHRDLAGLYRAMLLGRKRELSAYQQRLFLRAGAMHLFAVNGLHITTVALALHAILALVRCPRPVASAMVLAVLWLDVDTTGDSPSAVRAFTMAAAIEAAWFLWRPANLLASLTAAAGIVLLAEPMVFFGASFQMSYGVMAGLATLGLPLAAHAQEKFKPYRDLPRGSWSRRQRAFAWLLHHFLGALGVGAAAAAVGALTGVEFFQLLVPGGLATNLVLVPPALLVIVAGAASLALGFAGAAAAGRFFNLAAGAVLAGMTWLARAATAVPGVYLAAHYRAPWIGPAALGALLAACFFGYGEDWRRERGGFLPPFAVVALVLMFGISYQPTGPAGTLGIRPAEFRGPEAARTPQFHP